MIDKNLPLVSILVPSYNHSSYILNCIESIYLQSYQNFELFVIDDGSNDGSDFILKQLQSKYGFHLQFTERNGLVKNMNICFRDLSSGKYLTFCSSDDFWETDKLKLQVEFMEANPEYAMVYGKAKIIDPSGRILDSATREANEYLVGGEIFNDLLLLKFHPPVNYLFRRSALKEIGFYDEEIWAEDFDMNLRLSYKYKIGFIDSFISSYRAGVNGKEKMLTFKTINSHLKSLQKFQDTLNYKSAVKAYYYRCFTWYACYGETKIFAIKCLYRSIPELQFATLLPNLVSLILRWR